MTYGWAILTVALALGAIYSLGILNPETLKPQVCSLSQPFYCSDQYLDANGFLTLTIAQGSGSNIRINKIACVDKSLLNQNGLPLNPSYWNNVGVSIPSGSQRQISNIICYSSSGNQYNGKIGSVFSGAIVINATTQTSANIFSIGELSAQVKVQSGSTVTSIIGLGGTYRKPITIDNTNNANTLSNYQVLVTLDTASLISAGKMRSDCGDVRFKDSDAQTQLSYWIESGCNSANTRIWVKVPTIPASSTKTIYVYYGNPSATSQSNGSSTFLAFNLKWDGPIGGRTSIGGYHTCALLSDGSAKCWGADWSGQLGDGTSDSDSHPTPVLVTNLANAVAITTGDSFTCALLSNGSAKCWGDRYHGELGIGTSDFNSPIPILVTNLANAVAITAGESHACALLANGSAKCWGSDWSGELGIGTSDSDSHPTPVLVTNLANAVAMAGGGYYTCALLNDGTAECWGYNRYGELGDGTNVSKFTPVTVSGLTNAVAITAGEYHTCALLSDGSVKCWGKNDAGQLGIGTSDSNPHPTPVLVTNLANAVAITAGYVHTCALLSNGSIKCWGDNSDEELGDGTSNDSPTPVLVTNIANAVAITAGVYHTCALLSDGSAKCWGYNDYGELGDGTTTQRNTPVSVLNYNLGGKYDKTNGILTLQKSPQIDTYFIRAYASPEPTTSVGAEQSV